MNLEVGIWSICEEGKGKGHRKKQHGRYLYPCLQ